MVNQDTFSELSLILKKGREFSGLSTRDAGERAGVSFAYLNQMENGRVAKPSPVMLQKLSRLYSIPFDLIMEKAGHISEDVRETPDEIAENLTILIIDSSGQSRDEYINYLSRPPFKNCMFIHAKTGEEGILLSGNSSPDCILLGHHLADIDAMEVLKAIKKNPDSRSIPVVYIISSGNETSAIQSIFFGANSYIIKDKIEGETLARSVISAVKLYFLHKYAQTSGKTKARLEKNDVIRKISELEKLSLLLVSTTDTPAWEKMKNVDRSVCGGVQQLSIEIADKIQSLRELIKGCKC